MVYYLIVCRSLTYAQRTASALERAGITAHILRSPKMISGEGCSHSVKVSERNLAPAASPAAHPLQEQLQRNRALWTRVVQADRAASGRLCGKDSFYDS